MQQKKKHLSLVRVVQSDFAAFLALAAPIVTWAIYIVIAYLGYFPAWGRHESLGSESAPFFLYASLVTTLIGVPLFLWRLHFFRSLRDRGVPVAGYITGVLFHRDRGRIEYDYTYQDKSYSSYNAVMKTARTRSLPPASAVTVLVDPNNPQRSFILDLVV